MLDKLKHLAKHSFIYSISNVALKATGIILLPLYTEYFSLEEYGRLGLLLITIPIISQTLVLGQNVSIIRFTNSEEFKGRETSALFTLTLFLLLIAGVFIITCEGFLPSLAALLGNRAEFELYLQLCIYIIALIIMNNLFLNKLRADDRSVLYTLSGIIKLLVMMALTIYLIVVEKMGIEAVLYGQLFGEISNLIIILPYILKNMKVQIEADILKESLRYGMPLIFFAMGLNLLNGSDRYLIKYLADESSLGLYELAYKVAGVHNMFLIMPINLSLLPLAFKLYKKEGDKRYYSKLKTYFSFIMVWAGLGLSVFSKEIVILFAQDASYYPGYEIVPLIVLAYIFYGQSLVSSLGMYLTGNNKYVAVITVFCALLNIGLNFWLIPVLGITGAALNTLIAFIILDVLSQFASNRYYRISYENRKIWTLLITASVLFYISSLITIENQLISIAIKLILIISLPLLLKALKFYEERELSALKGAVKKWKNPVKWVGYIREELMK